MTQAFFLPEGGGRFTATELTRGPWSPDAQHAGPPCALLGWCLERAHPREAAIVSRITVEILRPVPIASLEVSTQVLRPGRQVELLGATMSAEGVEILRASAWRLRTADIGFATDDLATRPAAVADSPAGPFFDGAADVGYHTAMEFRFARGSFVEPGPAAVWMRPRVPLVAGEPLTPLTRVLVAADSGNGISAVRDPRELLFVNTDLTVFLRRLPETEWVCLDAVTQIEGNGTGLTTTVLHDERGSLGTSLQTLFVAPR